MQVENLRADIGCAFDDVSYPTTVKDMIAAPYRSSEDAHEMAVAFLGKPWAAISIEDLFRHREMLFTLAPAAYVAYLPAYLAASLATEDPFDKHGPDLREYLLDTLAVAESASQDRTVSTQARLAELTTAQLAVVVDIVRYLAQRWNMPRAKEILDALAADHDRK